MFTDHSHDPLPLQELRSQYSADLFDDYLPFLAEHVIDHEFGGFLQYNSFWTTGIYY